MSTRARNAVKALQRLLETDTRLLSWAQDWAEGFGATSPTSGQGGGHGKGDHATPVEAQVIASDAPCRECGRPTPCDYHPTKNDQAKVWAHREGAGLADRAVALHNQIGVAVKLVLDLYAEARELEPLAPEIARSVAKAQEPRAWGAGSCAVCESWVVGVGEDRLKSGMCRKHYDAWRYYLRTAIAPVLDRVEWIRREREAIARAASIPPVHGEHKDAGRAE